MSSQPLFKQPRAIKSPQGTLTWGLEITPTKKSHSIQKGMSLNMSGLDLSKKESASNKNQIPSPMFLGKGGLTKFSTSNKKDTLLGRKDQIKDTIRLPSLIPVKRVVTANPADQLGSAELREKKLLRRRLNSEDEKSLISFSKMEIIFGGRDKKMGLNEGFQNPRKQREQRQSQVIYDGIASAKRKTSRKKSEDLGGKLRTRNSILFNEIRNKSENNCRKQILLKNIVAAKNQNLKGKEFPGFNEPYKGKKIMRKESEHAFDGEQENTKGSSFNTDRNTKGKGYMNHLLGHSDNDSHSQNELLSKKEGSKLDYLSQGSRKRIKNNVLKEIPKRDCLEADLIRPLSRRKSSFVSLRKESILIDKSENDNVSEQVMMESHMGSMYRRAALHFNIGSQISEESKIDSEMDMENINVWKFKGEDGENSELQWQIRFLDLLDKEKVNVRSRKHSEIISGSITKSNYYKFITNIPDLNISTASNQKNLVKEKVNINLQEKKPNKKAIKKSHTLNNLIGKRESFEKEVQPVKVLTKKQRRNKHSKHHVEWLLEESEENKKKKMPTNSLQKSFTTTKFVLTRDTKGMGISFFNNPKRVKGNSGPNAGLRNKNITNLNKGVEEKKGRMSQRKQICGRGEGKANGKNNEQKNPVNKGKDSKTIPKMVWNSRGQCDEKTKLQSKINKVRTYWNRTSLLIPNVFRHVSEMRDEPLLLFEYLDLSRKELLVQANGQKAISQAGAPHLQRKNKGAKNNSSGKNKIINNPKQFVNYTKVKEDSMKIIKSDQVEVKQQILKEEKIQEKNNLNNIKCELQSSDDNKNLFLINLNTEKNTNQKEDKISEEKKKEESKKLFEENLAKIKKQLREDLNKAHQKIELSFISEKAENWSRNDLDTFNNNISEYNQLLDEQEKLRFLQIGEEEKNKEKQINPCSLNLFEKRLNKPGQDDIKKKISMYVQRKGLDLKDLSNNGGNDVEKPSIKLTLQDILRLELNKSLSKGTTSSLSKLSKRIHKRKLLPLKKKFSVSINGNPKLKKSQYSKKNSLPHTNLWGVNSAKRKATEDRSILEDQNDEDLAISINSASLEDLSETSVCSLKEHFKRINNTKNQIIIRN
jgi:hypothetical protein